VLEARRVSLAGMLFLPAALVVYFAFNTGGFYPGAPAYIAMLLCVLLAVRALLGRFPLAGASALLALAGASMALLALLTVLSGSWSHAPGVARVEFDLPLVYLLAMVACGSIGRTRTRLRWMLRGLAAATVIVCGSGLISRTLPHVWPTTPTIVNNRLSFPVTYWNVLALLAALGIVMCVHLSSDLREHWAARVLGAGAVPVLASTLLLTFSRGGIGICLVALVVYVVLGRSRGLVSSLIAVLPSAAVAVKVAYDANLLGTFNPTTPAAVSQGHHVATVVVICVAVAIVLRAALALLVDERLRQFPLQRYVYRPPAWAGWLGLAALAAILIVGFRHPLSREYHAFFRSEPTNQSVARNRLTDPSANGRISQWKVAIRGFKSAPILGHGAGTYQDEWARHRPNDAFVLDAHSLYLETMDELGIVGLVALVIPILAILVRVATRIRGSGRPLYAAVFAVLLAWAIHAGVDWDWEMPVVSVIFFSLGGFVLGRRLSPDGAPRSQLAKASSWLGMRMPVALAFLLLAVLPSFTWVSQQHLDGAAYAFSQGDCGTTRQDALASIGVLGDRAEPYEYLAYCDVRLGRPREGLRAIQKAVSLDPNNWNYRYDLAVMRAANGLDPRAAARLALRFDPREPLVQAEWQAFRGGTRPMWRAEAADIVNSFNEL
jgi:O-antigen ligase